ncbi:protein mitoshell [Drosophila subobscura]|uniref:protein mitoshell n=1 Tax=Drosophila subobscura TaxID=7241 RepID=UPI00155B28AC|nr:protein mitoshell [Drosophila subobscura]
MNMSTFYVRYPTMSAQSLHQQSMYHQTYMDRHRHVTDVFVQEQYSQREFYAHNMQSAGYLPPPFTPYTPRPSPATSYEALSSQLAAFRPAPPVSYYSGIRVNSAGWHSSSGRFMYHPEPRAAHHYPTAHRGVPTSYGESYSSDSSESPPPIYYMESGTQTMPIQCADAATQSNMDLDEHDNSEASNFISMERWAVNFIRGLSEGQGERRNSEMKLPEAHLKVIFQLALDGSDISERVAQVHCNRPCFKKIDTLCARLKQDLCRLDGVQANINSQGIAWAVKDFIFLFTRILNAWTILKSYVYNQAEGIRKIIDQLPVGFMQVFNTWQLACIPMIDMIIQSIVRLDACARPHKTYSANGGGSGNGGGDNNAGNRSPPDAGTAHTPRNRRSPCAGNRGSHSPTNGNRGRPSPCDHHGCDLSSPPDQVAGAGEQLQAGGAKDKPHCCQNLIDLYTMIENSEDTQRHVDASGTYLRTGTYQPLQKEQRKEPQQQGPEAACKPKPIAEYESYLFGYDEAQVPSQLPPFVNENADDPGKLMPDLRENGKSQPMLEFDPYVPCYGPNPTKPPERTPELETCELMDTMVQTDETPWKGNAMQGFYPTPPNNMSPRGSILPHGNMYTHSNMSPTSSMSPPSNMFPIGNDTTETKYLSPEKNEMDTKAHNQLLEYLEPYAAMLGSTSSTVENIKKFMNPYSAINVEVARQLIELKERILELQNVAHFFQKQFTMNYYPDFYQRCNAYFIDLRAIILKCESGTYHHAYQAVHDLRRIVFVARCYLKVYFNKKLSDYIDLYEFSLGEMLSKPPHKPHEHDHIIGEPGETIFNYDLL